MKKYYFLSMLFSLVSLTAFASDPFAVVKTEQVSYSKNPNAQQTIVELGDFMLNGDLYGVFGDSSTGEVTSVRFNIYGDEVYYFESVYAYRRHIDLDWTIYLNFKPYSTSTMLNYEGVLLYY